jgi:endonuclease YncB( thermonuclease family)
MGSGSFRGAAFLAAVLGCLSAPPASAADRWYTYEECRLIPAPANDGDSFHVQTKSDHRIFRLYFVDAPESDRFVPERVKEQAEYWGIAEEQVLKLAVEAAAFTSNFLSRGFTVCSKREDARGQSDMQRFYALVTADDRSLAEELVRNGLARVFGRSADLPDGTTARRYFTRLRAAEREAREARKGAWKYAVESKR